jgi:hypothetical protein
MPNLIMASALAMLFFMLFSPVGPINQMLTEWEVMDESILFFNIPITARGIIALMNFLMWFGNTTILLMAGIMGIDKCLFETAEIDTASTHGESDDCIQQPAIAGPEPDFIRRVAASKGAEHARACVVLGREGELWSRFAGNQRRFRPVALIPAGVLVGPGMRLQLQSYRLTGKGMTTVVGRVRRDPILDLKFVVLSHNTIRGAAGGSIYNAELLVNENLL